MDAALLKCCGLPHLTEKVLYMGPIRIRWGNNPILYHKVYMKIVPYR